MRIVFFRALIATTLLAACPSLVQAQRINSIGSKQPGAAPVVPPPPALPGASSGNSRAAPSFRPPSDMEPSEALFDAINRGDIGAARDAISRGADLNGHNILGMTPMELSVDLGRSDISFLLLSMRGGDNGRSSQPPAQSAGKPEPAKNVRQAGRPAVTPARSAAAAQPPATAQTARLFSGGGGSPIPNAGFLGFNASRP
jgi:hypothetical protein